MKLTPIGFIINLLVLFTFIPTINGQTVASDSEKEIFQTGSTYRAETDTSHANFIINKWDLRPTASLETFRARLDSLLRATTLLSVDIESAASPDGPWKWNEELAQNRARVMIEFLREKIEIPDSILQVNCITEQWEGLRDSVINNTSLPQREEMLRIIDSRKSPDQKERELRALKQGWRRLTPVILPSLRYSYVRAVTPDVTLTYDSRIPREPIRTFDFPPTEPPVKVEVPTPIVVIPPVTLPEPWLRHWYVSTNLIGAAMAIENIAGEVDLAPHFSARLALYHAGWDYFKSTIKFRNLSVFPEVRFWSKPNNTGFFADAHLGLAYYNVALDGAHRYQDHNGRTPALGGGIGLGARWFISADRKWMMECSVGGGIYRLDYDIFDNTPDVKDGLLMDRRKRTFYGVDNAAISIVYRFGAPSPSELKIKKGGNR